MLFCSSTAAIRGPTPFTYCTPVESSSTREDSDLTWEYNHSNRRVVRTGNWKQKTGNWFMHFGLALLSVLLGNTVYFLLLPHLPAELRHEPPRLDLGLALDFILCLALWLGFTAAARRRKSAP